MSARRRPVALSAVALLALAATPIAPALARAPASDQYIPIPPTATGDVRPNVPSDNQLPGSDDQSLGRITGGDKPSGAEAGRQNRGSSDIEVAAPPAGSDDDDDGDGALAAIGSALTDWHDPVVPGSVVLVALATLGTAITVLVRRGRGPA